MRRIWIIVAALPLFSACATPSTQSRVTRPTTLPVELHSSIEKLSIDAAMGDPVAAAKLSEYFLYEKNMDPKWKYWTLIAAENGFAQSQFEEYEILAESDNPISQHRAFYWLKKSAKGGYFPATVELNTCFPSGNFESRKPECMGVEDHKHMEP